MTSRSGIAIALVAMLGGGCGRDAPPAPVEVTVHGALRELMHGGSAEGRVALAEVARPGVVAIGALADLRGEVTILDGQVRTSVVDGAEIATRDQAGDARAALLVVATVPAWRELTIAADLPADGVEAGLAALLRGAGVRLDVATPLVIEGRYSELAWHVVDGPHSHGAPSGLLRDTPGDAVLVGFFSTAHEGVFTHMGQASHLHVLVPGATGHVDRVAITAGARLRIPR